MSGEILVIGGTGKVGSRLVTSLRERGATPRIASRTGGDVRFDWGDPATWRPALTGATGVFVVGPGSGSDWSPRLGALLEVATEVSVTHAVLLSARAVEFLPDGVVAATERVLREGPVPWTILRPAHFAQNFTEAMFTPVDGIVSAPVGDGAEPFIDVHDIAEVAAEILDRGSRVGEILELSGPAALSFTEAAAVLADVSGDPVRFVDQDRDAHIAALHAAGTPELYVTWRMAMLDAIARGDDAYLSDGVERVLGRPATPFAAWAARQSVGSGASTSVTNSAGSET
jgi:uncharacterized protein YbjT (DUF2867 family)